MGDAGAALPHAHRGCRETRQLHHRGQGVRHVQVLVQAHDGSQDTVLQRGARHERRRARRRQGCQRDSHPPQGHGEGPRGHRPRQGPLPPETGRGAAQRGVR